VLLSIPGDALTSSRPAGSNGSSSTEPPSSSTAAAAAPGIARFHESLSIKGLRLSASIQLVFELYCAKPAVVGLPSKELLVAWAAMPLLQGGQVGGCERKRVEGGREGGREGG